MLPGVQAKKPRRAPPKPPAAPPALQRFTKQLELRESIAKLNAERLKRQAQEARNNVATEMQRLRTNNEGTLPGLREYLAMRRAQGRRLQNKM